MIGRTFGRYRVVSPLGEGGMGSVWRAEDPSLGRTVALKLLSPALAHSDVARQRFIREARAVAKLDHPRIAAVYDIGETDDPPWIAYAYIDGETVAARVSSGPLPVPLAITLARGVTEALAHAHSRGVLHRDVTAGNVMVTREDRAMLVDFGLALPDRSTQLTATGTRMGTAGYLAPELLKGGQADERSDLYGLGAVLYKMLAGRLPFEGLPEAVHYQVLNQPVPPPSEFRPEVPAGLERVVLKLLEREPEDRYATAAEVEEALSEVAGEAAPSAADTRRRARARRWRELVQGVRRVGRARVGVTALAVTAFLVAGLWFAAARGWLPGTHHAAPVLAVLPFENLSREPDDSAYLGEGLGEELTLKLGDLRSVRVLPWASTRGLAKPTGSLAALASQLHADALLIGSFRSDGERLRVTVSLVDGTSGVQRWGRAFDELLSDFMTVQVNIASEVARTLHGGATPEDKKVLAQRPTTNPEAYELYLRGAALLNSPDQASQDIAEPFFARAVEVDSSLAEAHVGLGAIQLDRYFRGLTGFHALDDAEREMQLALRLHPGMPRALRGLLQVHYMKGQSEACLQIGELAASRGADDLEGLLIRGWACMLGTLPDVGVPIFERAVRLDPANREAAWFRTINLTWAEHHAAALESGKVFLRQFGEDPEIYTWMGASARCLGLERESQTYYARALELFGDTQSNLYSVGHVISIRYQDGDLAGARALARTWRDRMEARLGAAPDNDRVRLMLLFTECVLGDQTAFDRHVPPLIQDLETPGSPHIEGSGLILRCLCVFNEPALTEKVMDLLAAQDPAPYQGVLRESFHRFNALGPCPRLEQSPKYKKFVESIRVRNLELHNRYATTLGLKPKPGSNGSALPATSR